MEIELLLLETQGVTDFKNFSGKRTKKGLKKVDSEKRKINDQKECTYIDATVLRLTLANFLLRKISQVDKKSHPSLQNLEPKVEYQGEGKTVQICGRIV